MVVTSSATVNHREVVVRWEPRKIGPIRAGSMLDIWGPIRAGMTLES